MPSKSKIVNIGDEKTWPIFFCCVNLRKREFFIFINLMDIVFMNAATIWAMYSYYNFKDHHFMNLLNLVVYISWLFMALGSITAYLLSDLNFGRGIHMFYAFVRFFLATFEFARIILEIVFMFWAIQTETVEKSVEQRETILYWRLVVSFPFALYSWGWSYMFFGIVNKQRKFNNKARREAQKA